MVDILYLEMVPDAWRPERMLTVEHYELIRREVEINGKSQCQVAKELAGHADINTTMNYYVGIRESLFK